MRDRGADISEERLSCQPAQRGHAFNLFQHSQLHSLDKYIFDEHCTSHRVKYWRQNHEVSFNPELLQEGAGVGVGTGYGSWVGGCGKLLLNPHQLFPTPTPHSSAPGFTPEFPSFPNWQRPPYVWPEDQVSQITHQMPRSYPFWESSWYLYKGRKYYRTGLQRCWYIFKI